MQTQWSWILQLCYCVEQHLKENMTYFEVGDRLFCGLTAAAFFFSFLPLLVLSDLSLCSPNSFSMLPESLWTTLKAFRIQLQGSMGVTVLAVCIDWRISFRSLWLVILQNTIHCVTGVIISNLSNLRYDMSSSPQDEKEQLLQYRSTVAGLVGQAKSVVQLKPRNPENPVRTSLPVKAICEYRQIEVTPFRNMSLSFCCPTSFFFC